MKDLTDLIDYFESKINVVSYDENAFTAWYSGDKVLLGAILTENHEIQRFFSYATLYQTIIDADAKIKYSFQQAIIYADDVVFDNWNPLELPSENEKLAIYFTENAIYRTEILWDILAQLFNIKEKVGIASDRIYVNRFFDEFYKNHKENVFAKRVCLYMKQTDGKTPEGFLGNHAFVKKYRNQMTHRNSPNITTLSNFDVELRFPMSYVLLRVIEDYSQVSELLTELIKQILDEYPHVPSTVPEEFQETQ